MLILGIESSCDETAAAVIEDGVKILSNVVASSQRMHEEYKGILPDKAAREQLKCIIPVIQDATKSFDIGKDIDAIAITAGPGLVGSLLIGVETAKALAFAFKKPLVPINHLLGHIYANWLDVPKPPELPALVLLVSGGHSEIVLMTDHGKYKLLGTTQDDAAGECFDKCGRLLDLPYPYGPYIEKLAEKYDPQAIKIKISLPRPMLNSKDLNLSFSGLKTAFLNEFRKQKSPVSEEFKYAIAYELQQAVTDVLTKKFIQAAEKNSVKSFILAGGVAANKCLREKLTLATSNFDSNAKLHIPPLGLCGDNASYIASAAFFNYHPKNWEEVDADPSLDIA